MKKDTQIVGNTGMYWVCFKLSCLGWNCMPTSRNARGVDVIAYNYNCTRMVSIQVKSLSGRPPVPLGKSLEKIMGDFWIIVNDLAGGEPSVYIMTPKEVKGNFHKGVKEDRVSYWLHRKEYEKPRFKDAWSRLGDPWA